MEQAHLFGNENRASESLQDSVVRKPLQDFYSAPIKTPTALLSRDYRTLVSKIQYSYQETAGHLSVKYSTLIKRLQDVH